MALTELLCTAVLTMGLPNAQTACKYMPEVVAAAEAHEVEAEVLVALIHEESRWKPHAVSRSGACGLTQVLPKYTRPYISCKRLKNPIASIWAGAKALSYWLHKYGRGDYRKGLCGYNGGYRCKDSKSAQRYSRRVLRLRHKIEKNLLTIRAQQTN